MFKMIIRNLNFNENTRTLYVEFSTDEDSDEYYRGLWLSIEEIEFYSPTIITEDDLYTIDEEFTLEILVEYLKDNDLPEEQSL
jgi:hypothetical protein